MNEVALQSGPSLQRRRRRPATAVVLCFVATLLTAVPGGPPSPTAGAQTAAGGFVALQPTTVGTFSVYHHSAVSVPVSSMLGVPANASAVALTLTAVPSHPPGWVAVYPGGTSWPGTSNVNFGWNDTVSNSAVVKVGSDSVVLYSELAQTSSYVPVQVVVTGYFDSAGGSTGGSTFTPIAPARIWDSRSIAPLGPVSGVQTISISTATGIPANAAAVGVNLTVVQPNAAGWAATTFDTTGANWVSNPYFQAGEVVAAFSVANAASNGSSATITIKISSAVSTHVILDVFGWFGPNSSGSGMFNAGQPVRAFNTVVAADTEYTVSIAGRPLPSGGNISSNASAAIVNVTVAEVAGGGYASAYPANVSYSPTSVVNYSVGDIVSNSAILGLSGGAIKVRSSKQVRLIVDVESWFTPATAPTCGMGQWKAEYWKNEVSTVGSMSELPFVTRCETATHINFDWGTGPPVSTGSGWAAGDVNAWAGQSDYYSVRWTKQVMVPAAEAGLYQLTTVSDDGVRVLVDTQNRLDFWSDHGQTTRIENVDLPAGTHIIQVDYYERTAGSLIGFALTKQADATTTSAPPLTGSNLLANPSFATDAVGWYGCDSSGAELSMNWLRQAPSSSTQGGWLQANAPSPGVGGMCSRVGTPLANQNFTFKVWLRSPTVPPTLRTGRVEVTAEQYNGTGWVRQTTSKDFAAAINTWQQVSVEFFTSPSVAYDDMTVRIEFDQAGVSYDLDEASLSGGGLYVSPPPPNPPTNSGPPTGSLSGVEGQTNMVRVTGTASDPDANGQATSVIIHVIPADDLESGYVERVVATNPTTQTFEAFIPFEGTNYAEDKAVWVCAWALDSGSGGLDDSVLDACRLTAVSGLTGAAATQTTDRVQCGLITDATGRLAGPCLVGGSTPSRNQNSGLPWVASPSVVDRPGADDKINEAMRAILGKAPTTLEFTETKQRLKDQTEQWLQWALVGATITSQTQEPDRNCQRRADRPYGLACFFAPDEVYARAALYMEGGLLSVNLRNKLNGYATELRQALQFLLYIRDANEALTKGCLAPHSVNTGVSYNGGSSLRTRGDGRITAEKARWGTFDPTHYANYHAGHSPDLVWVGDITLNNNGCAPIDVMDATPPQIARPPRTVGDSVRWIPMDPSVNQSLGGRAGGYAPNGGIYGDDGFRATWFQLFPHSMRTVVGF